MVERSLSIREVPGSIPGASSLYFRTRSIFILFYFHNELLGYQNIYFEQSLIKQFAMSKDSKLGNKISNVLYSFITNVFWWNILNKLWKKIDVRCGVRTHAHIRVPELKSGALDHSANLTCWYITNISMTTIQYLYQKSKNCFVVT